MAKNNPNTAQAQQRKREAARAEAERLKAAQAAKERRTKLIAIAAAVVVVVAVAVAVVVLVRDSAKSNYGDIAKPLGGIETGSILIGQDLAAGGAPAEGDDVVILRIYSDYMCPGCGAVERRLGGKFEELAEAGKIKLEIQPVVFLDAQSLGTQYSTRSTNAALIVANYAPDKFLAFHAKLFESGVQPDEQTEGLTDERIAELAQEVGVPADVTERFAAQEFAAWALYATDKAQEQPVQSTPSLWMGKKDSDLTLIDDPGTVNLDNAIANILAGKDPNG